MDTKPVKKEERVQIALTEEEKLRLEELADANTGENKSLLIRRLLAEAWKAPEKFKLHPPKVEPLPSVRAPFGN